MYVRVTRARLVILAALLAAAGVYFLVDWLIVTDKERVERTLGELARAVEENDAAAVTSRLDASFRLGGMNADEFAAWYAGVLERLKVKRVGLYDCTVTLDDKDPDAASAAVMTILAMDRPPGDYRIDWRLEFRRRNKTEWKLAGVRAWQPLTGVEIPLRAADDWLR